VAGEVSVGLALVLGVRLTSAGMGQMSDSQRDMQRIFGRKAFSTRSEIVTMAALYDVHETDEVMIPHSYSQLEQCVLVHDINT
jgi:hypothetical protein